MKNIFRNISKILRRKRKYYRLEHHNYVLNKKQFFEIITHATNEVQF
jgi:hypothetical protein